MPHSFGAIFKWTRGPLTRLYYPLRKVLGERPCAFPWAMELPHPPDLTVGARPARGFQCGAGRVSRAHALLGIRACRFENMIVAYLVVEGDL